MEKKRLIDAYRLVMHLSQKNRKHPMHYDDMLATIADEKTVDAVEVVHGEWSIIEDDYCGLTAVQCSECNQEYWFEDEPPMKIYNYCPNCGAKMDGERKDNG